MGQRDTENVSTARENRLLQSRPEGLDWPLIDTIKQLYDHGLSLRRIADELRFFKSTTHFLHLWRPHQEKYHVQHTDWYLMNIGMKPVWWKKHIAELNAERRVRNAELHSGDDDEITGTEANAELCAQSEGQSEENPEPSDPPSILDSQLSIRLDAAGDKIHVEKEDERCTPVIWYRTNNSGTIFRNVRDPNGIVCQVPQPPHKCLQPDLSVART